MRRRWPTGRSRRTPAGEGAALGPTVGAPSSRTDHSGQGEQHGAGERDAASRDMVGDGCWTSGLRREHEKRRHRGFTGTASTESTGLLPSPVLAGSGSAGLWRSPHSQRTRRSPEAVFGCAAMVHSSVRPAEFGTHGHDGRGGRCHARRCPRSKSARVPGGRPMRRVIVFLAAAVPGARPCRAGRRWPPSPTFDHTGTVSDGIQRRRDRRPRVTTADAVFVDQRHGHDPRHGRDASSSSMAQAILEGAVGPVGLRDRRLGQHRCREHRQRRRPDARARRSPADPAAHRRRHRRQSRRGPGRGRCRRSRRRSSCSSSGLPSSTIVAGLALAASRHGRSVTAESPDGAASRGRRSVVGLAGLVDHPGRRDPRDDHDRRCAARARHPARRLAGRGVRRLPRGRRSGSASGCSIGTARASDRHGRISPPSSG